MSYQHNEKSRVRVLLDVAWREEQPVVQEGREGERFSCLVDHLDGEGLILVSYRNSHSADETVYHLNRRGALLRVFTMSSFSEIDIVEVKMSALGQRHQIECECSKMLGQLELLLKDHEALELG